MHGSLPSFETSLDSLEDFWDSGYPRIGERGARGWENARPATISATTSTSAPVTDDNTDPYIRWGGAEEHYGARDRLPARAEDLDSPGQDRDPYRVVLFYDVRLLLFDVQSDHGRQKMVFTALRLLGLWLNISISSSDDELHGAIDGNPNISSFDMFGQHTSQPRSLDSEPGKSSSLNTPVKCWASDLETLFSTDWFGDLDAAVVKLLDGELIRYVRSCGHSEVSDAEHIQQHIDVVSTSRLAESA